ncbi:MAG TPA: (2Fe-2S) ferredoxin domain-containing protein [Firmicutes bacterium]|nr:(2Fe-2S) ferredoxin domain-containing protein [Bacillota bacterium]HHY97341.1 (2Fe-2S) ferredoxin domain-containing protein [Bacillota bacterium]
MLNVSVCVGSSCHLRGAYDVIRALQDLIRTYGLSDKIDLSATFCLGHCTEGVTVKIGETIVTSVTPQIVERIFEEKVLPSVG